MRWFRSRGRFGAQLALAALALNLAFAFGHHHFQDIAAPLLAAAEQASAAGYTDDGDDDQHGPFATHPCFTCVAVTLAAIDTARPVLPARNASQPIVMTMATAVGRTPCCSTSFEARAPPQA